MRPTPGSCLPYRLSRRAANKRWRAFNLLAVFRSGRFFPDTASIACRVSQHYRTEPQLSGLACGCCRSACRAFFVSESPSHLFHRADHFPRPAERLLCRATSVLDLALNTFSFSTEHSSQFRDRSCEYLFNLSFFSIGISGSSVYERALYRYCHFPLSDCALFWTASLQRPNFFPRSTANCTFVCSERGTSGVLFRRSFACCS